MRSVLCGWLATTVMACGVFSSSDDAPKEEPALPPPGTPQDNATPPPVGGTKLLPAVVGESKAEHAITQ